MDLKIGSKVNIYLDKVIKINNKASKKKKAPISTSNFWNIVNGKEAVVRKIVSEDEVWVRIFGERVERMFNKSTLLESC